MKKEPTYHDDQIWTCEYDGCDGPQWATNYPKEGREVEGKELKLDMLANMFPPGTRVVIEMPCCPKCGDIATQIEPDDYEKNQWPDCNCGYSWMKWAESKW